MILSTTIVTDWKTDISALGPIYPFVGSEFLLWILGMAFWIAFHVIHIRQEKTQLEEDAKKLEKVSTEEELLTVLREQRLPS